MSLKLLTVHSNCIYTFQLFRTMQLLTAMILRLYSSHVLCLYARNETPDVTNVLNFLDSNDEDRTDAVLFNKYAA